ncbi:MAG: hypothetical protein ACD_62C00660G0002 [uncultured bacterium]|nr:MAG: hypothetical protein ACD_62C00660G0002 [uncultured bacterium]
MVVIFVLVFGNALFPNPVFSATPESILYFCKRPFLCQVNVREYVVPPKVMAMLSTHNGVVNVLVKL